MIVSTAAVDFDDSKRPSNGIPELAGTDFEFVPFHELPGHVKWNLPKVLYHDDHKYSDPGIDFSHDPGMCDQSQAQECDVNRIVKRFAETGFLPGTNVPEVFADVSDAPSYQQALDTVIRANEQFMSLDAFVRQKFGNDPANFLAFVNDPKNGQELVDMGLAKIRPPKDADRIVEAINASKSPSSKDSPSPKKPTKPASSPSAKDS